MISREQFVISRESVGAVSILLGLRMSEKYSSMSDTKPDNI